MLKTKSRANSLYYSTYKSPPLQIRFNNQNDENTLSSFMDSWSNLPFDQLIYQQNGLNQ